jgi:hypothetical protein
MIEVGSPNGPLDSGVVERQLARVSGVKRIAFHDPRQNHLCAEVESAGDRSIRSELARAIVEAGWELHELRASAISLEEIFLQLTREDPAAPAEETPAQEARA